MTIPTSQLITMPEGKTLELKRDISSPRNILKTLVAFAKEPWGTLGTPLTNWTKRRVGKSIRSSVYKFISSRRKPTGTAIEK